MLIKNFFAFILILFLFACSKDKNLYKPSLKIDPYKSYKEALDAFNNNQYFIANKKFSEAEINFKNQILLQNLPLWDRILFMELISMVMQRKT